MKLSKLFFALLLGFVVNFNLLAQTQESSPNDSKPVVYVVDIFTGALDLQKSLTFCSVVYTLQNQRISKKTTAYLYMDSFETIVSFLNKFIQLQPGEQFGSYSVFIILENNESRKKLENLFNTKGLPQFLNLAKNFFIITKDDAVNFLNDRDFDKDKKDLYSFVLADNMKFLEEQEKLALYEYLKKAMKDKRNISQDEGLHSYEIDKFVYKFVFSNQVVSGDMLGYVFDATDRPDLLFDLEQSLNNIGGKESINSIIKLLSQRINDLSWIVSKSSYSANDLFFNITAGQLSNLADFINKQYNLGYKSRQVALVDEFEDILDFINDRVNFLAEQFISHFKDLDDFQKLSLLSQMVKHYSNFNNIFSKEIPISTLLSENAFKGLIIEHDKKFELFLKLFDMTMNIWQKRFNIINAVFDNTTVPSDKQISKEILDFKDTLLNNFLSSTVEDLKEKVFGSYEDYLILVLKENVDEHTIKQRDIGLDVLTSNEVVSMLRKIYNVANEFFPSQEQEEYREKYSISNLFKELTVYLFTDETNKYQMPVAKLINNNSKNPEFLGLLERDLLNIAKSLFCGY